MLESFMIALLTLLIVLYVEARMAAQEIRQNRAQSDNDPQRDLVLKRRI